MFAIQVDKHRQFLFDFCFELYQALQYQAWLGHEIKYKFKVTAQDYWVKPKEIVIPVGSVEFVFDHMKAEEIIPPKPLNVPACLFPFAGREIFNGTEKEITYNYFYKSTEVVKGIQGFRGDKDIPAGNYQISSPVKIISEWRAFVYNGTIVGLHNYAGEFDVFPDVVAIKKMIDTFSTEIPAYTLDVFVNKSGTYLMEAHDFYSVGFYGFQDYRLIPFMFSKWYYYYVAKGKDGGT